MGESTEGQSSNQNDDKTSSLWHRIYRGKATIVALVLFIAGLAFLAIATIVHEEQSLTFEIAHHVLRDLGIAAIVSAVLGTAYEYLIRGDFVEDVEIRLRRAVKEERPTFVEEAEKSFRTAVTQERGKLKAEFVADASNALTKVLNDREGYSEQLVQFQTAGVTGVRKGRSSDWLEEMFSSKPKDVRILETWTGHRGARMATWIHKAAEAGSVDQVRILLLDPDSDHVGYRARALGWHPDDQAKAEARMKWEIETDLEEIMEICKGHEETIKIKLYDASPTVNMFCFDDIRIFGLYLRGTDSVESAQFIVDTTDIPNTFLAQQLDDHFEKLWSSGETRVWGAKELRERSS